MEFTEKELQLIYSACMSYGNQLSDMMKKIPNENEITDMMGDKAKESWDLARKVTNYMESEVK
jgi:hypothetical protein